MINYLGFLLFGIHCARCFNFFLKIRGFSVICNDVYRSQDWKCEHCGYVRSLVRPVTEASQALSKEAKELGSQINLQASIFLLAFLLHLIDIFLQ